MIWPFQLIPHLRLLACLSALALLEIVLPNCKLAQLGSCSFYSLFLEYSQNILPFFFLSPFPRFYLIWLPSSIPLRFQIIQNLIYKLQYFAHPQPYLFFDVGDQVTPEYSDLSQVFKYIYTCNLGPCQSKVWKDPYLAHCFLPGLISESGTEILIKYLPNEYTVVMKVLSERSPGSCNYL